jgi:hypothetical protein
MPCDKETAKERWVIDNMKEYRRFCGWKTMEDMMNAVNYDLRGPMNEMLVHN